MNFRYVGYSNVSQVPCLPGKGSVHVPGPNALDLSSKESTSQDWGSALYGNSRLSVSFSPIRQVPSQELHKLLEKPLIGPIP